MPDELKELVFLGNSRRALRELPQPVKLKVGRSLGLIQTGDTPANVKRLTGFAVAVLEIRVRHDSDAFRAIYTVSIGDKVYLLHVFQKKSKRGIGIPRRDSERIRQRIQDAIRLEAENDG